MLTNEERAFLEAMAKAPAPQDINGLRAMIEMIMPMMNQNLPEIGALHENVELRAGLRADIAVPKNSGSHPVVVYLHGGGWVAGSPRSHRKLAMQFAEQGYLTINVDYRLAPEHPFPAGLEDCVFAIKWAGENANHYGGDSNRIAVGGDSAGGNLTAASVAALAAENYRGPKAKAALLIYGVFDFPATLERASKLQRPGISMEMMTRAYLGNQYPAALADSRVSPLTAVKAGAFPPSFVICGTADELLPETKAIGEALRRADIAHEVRIFEEMPHGFLQMDNLHDCREAHKQMFDFLRRHL